MLFSVLIPTFNQAHYLKDCLESLIAQTEPNWEAIVVNDGSTDETAEILAAWAQYDDRIRVYHKTNGGTASALNLALEHARGEWMLWLSTDDLFELNKLAVLRSWIARKPDVRFFHADYALLDDVTKQLTYGQHPYHGRDLPDWTEQTLQLLSGNIVNGISICIHKEVFDRVGNFCELYPYAQDYDFWLRASLHYEFCFIPECLTITRTYPSQIGLVHLDRCLLDSARSGADLLNKTRFVELFPDLNWNDFSQVAQMVWRAFITAIDPGSFINQGGLGIVLLERIREFLASDDSEAHKYDFYLLFDQKLKQLSDAGTDGYVLERLDSLRCALVETVNFIPLDPFAVLLASRATPALISDPDRRMRFDAYLQFFGKLPDFESARLSAQPSCFDPATVPILINNRDQLTSLKKLVNWLIWAGHRNIIILDNDSAWSPLLSYYGRLPAGVRVLPLGMNVGPWGIWRAGMIDALGISGPYVVTDPDVLPVESCPWDAVGHFYRLLGDHPDVRKVGFSLKTDDLPDHYGLKEKVMVWEGQYSRKRTADGNFLADIDTTFALYRPGADFSFDGLRTGGDYVARHLPWYHDSENPSDETRFYLSRATPNVSNWSGGRLPDWLDRKITEMAV